LSKQVWQRYKQKYPLSRALIWFAEREGFEPSIPF
jgi:hypothetical protein